METNQYVRTTKSVINRIKKGNIRFDSFFQRQANQWNKAQKALLIDSILRGVPVPGVYLEKRTSEDEKAATYYVIDGCQRLSTIFEYMEGEWKLPKDLDPVVVDGEEFKISNKRFDQLDDTLQSSICDHSLILCIIESATPDEIVELFRRLNNGLPLTAAQRNKAVMGYKLTGIVAELADKSVFKKFLSPTQLKRDEAQMLVAQSLMLLSGETVNMRNKQIQKFLSDYSQHVSDKDIFKLSAILDKLDEILVDERYSTLKKVALPAIVKAMSGFYEDNAKIDVFGKNLLVFLSDPRSYPGYTEHVSAQTSDKDHIDGRVAFFESLAA